MDANNFNAVKRRYFSMNAFHLSPTPLLSSRRPHLRKSAFICGSSAYIRGPLCVLASLREIFIRVHSWFLFVSIRGYETVFS
jgi:hypothetical protein